MVYHLDYRALRIVPSDATVSALSQTRYDATCHKIYLVI